MVDDISLGLLSYFPFLSSFIPLLAFLVPIIGSRLFTRFKKMKAISKRYKNLEKSIEKLSHGKDILIIFLAKLMVGTRILLFIYMGGKKINFLKFFSYNLLPTFVWGIVLAAIGVLTARGFDFIASVFEDIRLAITFLIAFLLLFYILQKWLSQRLMKKQKKSI